MRGPTSIAVALRRYRDLHLEYSALRVVGRGLFLAVMLMVAFLYVFSRSTDVLSGANQVLIPTAPVATDLDIGALAQGAFTRTSASVVSVLGALTLILSALLSGHALRDGSRRALLGDRAGGTRLISTATVVIALVLSAVVLATWLLTLATSIRRRAWVALLGRDLTDTTVNLAKVLAVMLALALIAGAVLLVVRIVRGSLSGRSVLASLFVAVVVVVANFVLLYTYVGALINPAVSAGIVLILTLLLWVNIVVRTYLGALSWIAAGPDASAR